MPSVLALVSVAALVCFHPSIVALTTSTLTASQRYTMDAEYPKSQGPSELSLCNL